MQAIGLLDEAFTVWPIDQYEKDFQVIEKVGQGQFGTVFSVKPTSAADINVYAAKVVRCEGASGRLRIRDEMDLLGSLKHPNILRLITAYEV